MLELFKYTDINNHFTNLIDNIQLPHDLMYSLKRVELEMLMIYIKTNLANGIIKFFKLLINTLLLFIYKKDIIFSPCFDYQSVNNLIIKNYYLIPLIDEFFNCLNYAKYFI